MATLTIVPTHVFVVIRALFSENTLMVNVMGVFAHMHQATRYVAESKELDANTAQARWTIEKHSVSGLSPEREGVQTDPTAMAVRAAARVLNHDKTCVVYCVGNYSHDLGHSDHRCWCSEGALSFDQFKARHTEWADTPSEDWLETGLGTLWLDDMAKARA